MHSIHVKIEEPYSVSDKNVIAQINNPEVLIELIVAQIRWFLPETLNMSCTKHLDITLSRYPSIHPLIITARALNRILSTFHWNALNRGILDIWLWCPLYSPHVSLHGR